nr:hypothetical protein [Tanacetum cinerariifolium]
DSEEELSWKSFDDEDVGSHEEGKESDGSDNDSDESVKSGAEYRDEIKIDELKGNFNSMSIEINKKEKLQQLEQVANLSTYPSKRFNSFCYDDDDDDEDYAIAVTPSLSTNEPDNSLSMGDGHLDTIPATKSNEFIKSNVENLVPIPSESEGESEYDGPAREEFTTFSNILFDAEYEFDFSDGQSFSDEYLPKEIYLNPLFEEEIIPIKIDPHHYNAESDLIESLRTHDSSIIISSKIDSLFDEFAGELTLLKSIPPGIDETYCDTEEEFRLIERLLYRIFSKWTKSKAKQIKPGTGKERARKIKTEGIDILNGLTRKKSRINDSANHSVRRYVDGHGCKKETNSLRLGSFVDQSGGSLNIVHTKVFQSSPGDHSAHPSPTVERITSLVRSPLQGAHAEEGESLRGVGSLCAWLVHPSQMPLGHRYVVSGTYGPLGPSGNSRRIQRP